MNDISPKTSSKLAVPPQYELPKLRKRGDAGSATPVTSLATSIETPDVVPVEPPTEQAAPTAEPAALTNQEAISPSEKFSSRGRKIIPKKGDDEVTGLSRKGRRTPSNKDEPELKGRARRTNTMPAGTIPEPDVGAKTRRGRKTSLRSNTADDESMDSQANAC